MGDFDAGLLQCPADSTPVASKLGGQFIGAGSGTVLFYDLADLVIGQAFLFLRISIDFGIGSIGSVGHIRIDIETAGLKGCIMLCPVFEYARGRVETRSQKCHHTKESSRLSAAPLNICVLLTFGREEMHTYAMTGTSELKTKRLLLRRYRLDDASDLYEKFGRDPEMYRYSGWNPYASYDMAKETVRRFIESYNNADFYGWAIEFQGELTGTLGAYDYDAEKNQIEVGLSISKKSWGRGFAAEALAAVLVYLTEHEGIREVTAWCASDNKGSIKAMEKAGMRQTRVIKNGLEIEGKRYDQLFYSYHTE